MALNAQRFWRMSSFLAWVCGHAGTAFATSSEPQSEAEVVEHLARRWSRLSTPTTGHSAFLVDFSLQQVGQIPLATVTFRNNMGTTVIALRGAQVVSWKPEMLQPLHSTTGISSTNDVFWLSSLSGNDENQLIRGGLAQLGPWPPQRRSRGFLRRARFMPDLLSIHETGLTFKLPHSSWRSQVSPDEWTDDQGNLDFATTITATRDLEVMTKVTNVGKALAEIDVGCVAHFATPDITQTKILGLQGKHYLDRTQKNHKSSFTERAQSFGREIDRVFLQTGEAPYTVLIPGRRIRVEQRGGRNMVVWNPGLNSTTSRSLRDVTPDGVARFVCTGPITRPGSIRIPPRAWNFYGMRIAAEN